MALAGETTAPAVAAFRARLALSAGDLNIAAEMKNSRPDYPDISDILAQKAAGRRQRAALSFAEKLAILDALKERVAPLVEARKVRTARQHRPASRQD
jgi:hypothetical protein